MRTIAIMNQKGGTAKTATTVNLAAALAELGKQILVVDLDPQANASSWLGVKDTEGRFYEALTNKGNLTNVVSNSNIEGVSLIPSSPWMVAVERALYPEEGAELSLRKLLGSLPKERWDFLLIDCPPTLGFLSISALAASEEVLVPVQPHVMPLEGLAHLMETIEHVKIKLNPALRLSAILPSLVDLRTNLNKEVIQSLKDRFPDLVFDSMVRSNIRIAESYSFAKPITTYDPTGPGAQDYRAVAQEFVTKF